MLGKLSCRHLLPDRNDVAGAFGDFGTFAPLVVGMISVCQLNPANVMIVFGSCYLLGALVYRMPISVQPMKAIAALAIAGGATMGAISGSSLTIGVAILVLTITGSLEWFAKMTPRVAVRGIQLGLALTLVMTSIRFMRKTGTMSVLGIDIPYYALTILSFVMVAALANNRKIPSLFILIPMGMGLAAAQEPFSKLITIQPSIPALNPEISFNSVVTGFMTLALPQIPLTIGNSVIATASLSLLLFPNKKTVTVRKLGFTLGIMNVLSSIFGGIPMCHGAGGLAAHYRFGARTVAAPIVIGLFLVSLGLLYGKALTAILNLFPLPILGVILFFSVLELALVARDVTRKYELLVAILVAAICAFVPYGFLVGWPTGIILGRALERKAQPLAKLVNTAGTSPQIDC